MADSSVKNRNFYSREQGIFLLSPELNRGGVTPPLLTPELNRGGVTPPLLTPELLKN